MDLENIVLKRYSENDKIEAGYYLRIREKTTGKNKVSKEIKVYYGGIKVFDVVENAIKINSSIFIPNSKNSFKQSNEKYELIEKYRLIPNDVLTDMTVIDDYFDFYIGSQSRGEDRTDYKIALELTDEGSRTPKNELMKLSNNLKTKLGVYSELFSSIELKDTPGKRPKILLYLKNEMTAKGIKRKSFKMTELYSLVIWLLKGVLCDWTNEQGKRYFMVPKLNITTEAKKNINPDLSALEPVLERRVKTYIGEATTSNDYQKSKPSTNQEKQFQQNFMVKLNQTNKSDTFYTDKDDKQQKLYSKDIYPFELEYVIYAGKPKGYEEDDDTDIDDEKSQSNIKGRIDNTFVDGDTATLVEIKYGNGVIDKSNGIHKHLVDLYSCLRISKSVILEEYQERVNLRRKALNFDDNTTTEDITINSLEYHIVCIYNSEVAETSSLSMQSVQKKIDEIYMVNSSAAGLDPEAKKVCDADHDEEICADVNTYCDNLLKLNVPELIEKVENQGCPVKILLVDEEFKNFKEYKYKDKLTSK